MNTMMPEERFDRIERTLEFIAANQASQDARIAENSRLIRENSQQIRDNSQQTGEISQQLGALLGLTLRLGRVVEEQSHRIDRFEEVFKALGERLNALINVVERYFSNGRH